MQKYIDLLLSGGADLAMKINAETVKTAAWTVYRCHYGCDFYGKSHCCPPNSPTWKETREMLDCFEYGILFRSRKISDITSLAVGTARELFLDGYYKTMAFGSGPCTKCSPCNAEYCNFPYQAVPSMEGCGIDVFATVRANNIAITTLRKKGELASFFGLIMVE
ncbi:MAG: DUF2284 domain-containing protein [Bacillota bacterium]